MVSNFNDRAFFLARKSLLLLLVLAGFLEGCKPMAEILPASKLGKVDSELVLYSYISPQDTLVKVYLTESVPVYASAGRGERLMLDDALVVLSSAGRDFVLQYDSTMLSYTLSAGKIGIFPGNTYHLRVEHGGRVAEASTTIPRASPQIESYKIDSSFTSFSDFFGRMDTTLTIQFAWRDFPGEANYYRVSGRVSALMSYADYDSDDQIVERRGRVSMSVAWASGFGADDFQSDLNYDGATLHSPLGRIRVARPTFWTDTGMAYAKEPTEVRSITLTLYHTDEHYYRYHRSVRENQQATDNPFAEPVLLYTNVRGGLGVFASHSLSSISVRPYEASGF